ncbi:MAG: CDP-6-deoxy-delta-3,4-glucoseen reductase [Xanthomonadales bacterium]|nr:CDP-6-deoxy-delta-3,4-glucoseen reductase [Xanthomonadales bacterium]
MTTYRVQIAASGKSFTVNEGETVLTAALRQGVMLPYSCKNGTCGSCRGNLIEGDVHYPFHPPLALQREDIADGAALFCQAEPTEDLVIEVREIEAVRDIAVRRVPARVQTRERLSEDVMRVVLKLPAAQRLQFLAGQYIDILLPDGRRRAFSIASGPSNESEIELHIRHVEGGDFTGFVFDTLRERDILRIEGPQGIFFIRNDAPERPLVMVGGGTGFAPLKSMVEDLLSQDDQRPLHLFWGARTESDMYQRELAERWARDHRHIEFTPVLEAPPEGWQGGHGFVHEVVAGSRTDLADVDVYMSGPPAMIEAGKATFTRAGLPPDRLFYDSFEYGLDVPVRVLARPH